MPRVATEKFDEVFLFEILWDYQPVSYHHPTHTIIVKIILISSGGEVGRFFLQSVFFKIEYNTVAPMAQLDRASDYGSEG